MRGLAPVRAPPFSENVPFYFPLVFEQHPSSSIWPKIGTVAASPSEPSRRRISLLAFRPDYRSPEDLRACIACLCRRLLNHTAVVLLVFCGLFPWLFFARGSVILPFDRPQSTAGDRI